jgi:hypothetical protein
MSFETFLNGHSEAEQDRMRTNLVSRARTVRAHGWGDYRTIWSSGEIAGVAYLLEDKAMMRSSWEDEESVLSRYSGDLFGVRGCKAEQANGYPDTRKWFDKARAELAN